ncbi:MAG TPA: cupredoxin domain-containing protein [Actinomycetota bacterium]|nr:cupredoxin domain-containing protein [Actinomycetota bacterium]
MGRKDRTSPPTGPRQSLWLPIAIPLGLLAIIGLVLWGFSRVLLQVEPEVATITALVIASAIVAIVAIAASRKRVGNGTLLNAVVGVFGVGMVVSGAALLVGQSAEEGGPEAVAVALAAPEGAAVSGFGVTELMAPADTPFTIAFNNQDPGVPHNVAVATADPLQDPGAEVLLDGEIITGPMQLDYEVSPLAEADYFFYCKVHPTTMTGTLTVAVGAEPGAGGSGGNAIAAAGLAFDTDELSFEADTPTELTFKNNDAGVAHNVAIYTDESASESLFVGELVTGVDSMTYEIPKIPAGSYFFRCDIHPSMHGTVTVTEGTGGGGGPEPPPPSESAAPPPSEPPSSSSSVPPPSGAVTVTAVNLLFDPTELSLPAGETSTITLDNQDGGIPHNIAIYTDDSYSKALYTGELFPGAATKDYEIPALEPGTYPFRCDAHPTTMLGTLTVG